MAASGGKKGKAQKVESVVPGAKRTISSLRDIGYELPQAIADLIDNSISAKATEVRVDLRFGADGSWITVADNGLGMDTSTLTESLRYGSEREYDEDDLGKFGFGLKTASTSQCRRVVVASRRSPERARVEARALDLSHIERTNRWEILVVDPADRPRHLVQPLQGNTGTVVLLEQLDRVLPFKDPGGGWARKRMFDLADEVSEHLSMVFHRFLSNQVRGHRLKIWVNGAHLEPWDPFCLEEPESTELENHDFPVSAGDGAGIVHVRSFVLPSKVEFSTPTAWAKASGPLKWNRQQGLYVYRANRLIQWGGWNRLRAVDEHTKLARASIDFSTDLDSAFGINISKAVVKLPADLRDHLEPVVKKLASAAEQRYRKEGKSPDRPPTSQHPRSAAAPYASPGGAVTPLPAPERPNADVTRLPRIALEKAASEVDALEALERIADRLKDSAPEVARDLGW